MNLESPNTAFDAVAVPPQGTSLKMICFFGLVLIIGLMLSLAGPISAYKDINERMQFAAGTSEAQAMVTEILEWPNKKTKNRYGVRCRFYAFGQPQSTETRWVSAGERSQYRVGENTAVIFVTRDPRISRLQSEGLPGDTVDLATAFLFALLGLALTAFSFWLCKSSWRDYARANELDKNGLLTQGEVTSLSRWRGKGTHYDMAYRFIVGEKLFHITRQGVNRGDFETLTEGQTVRVRYLERDPRVSRAE